MLIEEYVLRNRLEKNFREKILRLDVSKFSIFFKMGFLHCTKDAVLNIGRYGLGFH